MKYEWRKSEKELYGAKKKPRTLNVPAQKFITISGKGNPNNTDFSNRVSALYALAYAIKMEYKKNYSTSEISDLTVYPLEGIWQQTDGTKLIKENLEYTIMICQPDVISQEIFDLALEKIKIKKPSLLYQEITFATIEAGIAVDILHLGTFDDEPASFVKMDAYLQENNLKRTGISHREIYLNNPNRVSKDKLKTILRYIVKE